MTCAKLTRSTPFDEDQDRLLGTSGARGVQSVPPRPIWALVSSRASVSGYDSKSPYMEQKRDKTGRFLAVFDPGNRPSFAINHEWKINYHNVNLLLERTCAPRTFVK